jgi:hypothetical protein
MWKRLSKLLLGSVSLLVKCEQGWDQEVTGEPIEVVGRGDEGRVE